MSRHKVGARWVDDGPAHQDFAVHFAIGMASAGTGPIRHSREQTLDAEPAGASSSFTFHSVRLPTDQERQALWWVFRARYRPESVRDAG